MVGERVDVAAGQLLDAGPAWKSRGYWGDAWRRLRRNRAATVGLVMVFFFLVLAIGAPLLAPHDPLAQQIDRRLEPPSAEHLLGRDELGRDVLSRIVYGARISLFIGMITVLIGASVGVPLGVISGFYGGRLDFVLQRIIDVMLAFPGILLAILVVSILGVNLANAMIAIGIGAIPTYARLVRGVVLGLRSSLYVEAARALGLPDRLIIWRYVLPNALSPLIVQTTLLIPSSILWAAGLGFLGLGAQPPTPEWGAMLSSSREYMRVAHHVVTFPGLAIVLTVLGFNLLGDGLRDALDPSMNVM